MHKKTTKSQRLTERRPGGGSPTFPHQRTNHGGDTRNHNSITAGIHSNKSKLCSSTWSRLPTEEQTSHSWSEDVVEDAASRRILDNWRVIERTLHEEEEALPHGSLFDECVQWRNQLVHLRIVGTAGNDRKVTTASSKASTKRRSVGVDELEYQGRDLLSKEASFHSFHQPNLKQVKEQVLDHILDYIYKELAEIEAEKLAEEEEDNLNGNFDECLKIAPAPTAIGKNPLNNNNLHHNVVVENTEASPKEDKDLRLRRNKLGTVFNERVIVSPVPFVVTTRESFRTLCKTPILYNGESNDFPNINRSGSRQEGTRRKLSLTGKTSLTTVLPRTNQPSWNNTPMCPTIWPKNVKLTPIDTSRLPSSKRRPTKTAESLPIYRNRHSLSPISRLVQPKSPRSCTRNDNHLQILEVRGSQIIAKERSWRPRKNFKSINDINGSLQLPEHEVRN